LRKSIFSPTNVQQVDSSCGNFTQILRNRAWVGRQFT
jgi:hypothetical protein